MYYRKKVIDKIKVRKDLFVWCFVLIVMAAIAVGSAEEGQVVVNPGGQTGVENETASYIPSADSKEWTRGSIYFKEGEQGVTVIAALRSIAAVYKKNIVPSPKVDGTITVTSLHDVSFEEAMDAILGYGFKWEQQGRFIRVYTAKEYQELKEDKSRMTHKVFTLYYISSVEARKLIMPVLSENAKIEASTAAQIGVPGGETIGGSGGGNTLAMNDTLIVYDYPENIAMAEDIIKSLDVRPKQVLIEAAILSATLTEDMQFGIDWDTLKGSAITKLSDITQDAQHYFKGEGTSANIESALTGGLTVGLAIDDIAGFIRAVEEITDVTLLANPKILTVNKQLGQVYIGNKLGYRVGDTFDAQGNRVEGTVKFLDTGTKLSFRPYIGDDGYIRMDIHPKDSIGSVPGGIPQETSAELITNIIVKDGQTIVIGGLFRDKITNVRTQVPILGDLPLIGAAFRGTADKVERQEVIVLLTPHIISEPEEIEGLARADDIRYKRFGAIDELQWMGRGRLAEDGYSRAAQYYIEGDLTSALKEVKRALHLRPTYIEAARLKEKILTKTDPEAVEMKKRIQQGILDEESSNKWLRR